MQGAYRPTEPETLCMRKSSMYGNRESLEVTERVPCSVRLGKVSDHNPSMYVTGQSDRPIVCAGQRIGQEGSSPSGAQMRGAVSKSGGNASLAEEGGRYWRNLNGHEGESWIQPRWTWSYLL